MEVFMNNVSFYGGESAGSIGYQNRIASKGGESAGSIGKIDDDQISDGVTLVQSPEHDTVNFKGKEHEEGSSFGKTLLGLAITAGVTIGGLAYAHKANWTSKLKDGNIKKYLSKATETSYDWCTKTKDFGVKYYNKVKEYFTKKS